MGTDRDDVLTKGEWMARKDIATIDFETRSAANIKKTGSWVYSQHPTTAPLCLAFRIPSWKTGRTELWHPTLLNGTMPESGVEHLVELFNWIIQGGLLEAHNAFFERGIWHNVMVPHYGWPVVAGSHWRCSAAKCAAHALPRGLDDASAALGLRLRKDAVGHKVMLKVSKPRKARKAEAGMQGLLWHESKELYERLFAYCRQDVLTEEAVSEAVPDLSEAEQNIYTLDQTINERGFLLDTEAVDTALQLIDAETSRLNSELKLLTGGSPDKGTQRKKMHDWFLSHWFILEDTKAGSVDDALKQTDLDPRVRRGLELLQATSRSSTAKYEAMRNWASGDGRVRGGLLYHGASTGRWPLTGDHEVLTMAGWRKLEEWSGGTIACWSEDGSMAWHDAKRLVFNLDPSEHLVHWRNAKVDQLSTLDHDMPVFVRERRSEVSARVWGGGFKRKQIGNMAPGDRIPLCGYLLASPVWEYTEEQTQVLLMTQADGHYLRENGHAVRYRFKKPRKINRCQELLKAAGIGYRVRVDACDGATVITVNKESCPQWLWDFDKVLSWDWLNADYDLVIGELEQWDGCKSSPNGSEYSSCIQQNADVIQAMAHLSGRTCKVTARKDRNKNWNTSWRCAIDHEPAPVTFRTSQRWMEEPRSFHVFCTQTPTGYFLVRRNGRAWITGNSGAGVQPHNFPRGSVKDMERAWRVLKTKDRTQIEGFKV